MDVSFIPNEPKVLASGYADGQKLELVQTREGAVAILQNGSPLNGIDAGGLDACVRLYLAMMRHRPVSGTMH